MNAQINNISMAYDDSGGDGDPVLWVHGFPLNRTFWKGQVEALSADARHIVPDLRGFGESDVPSGNYTMDLYANDLRALMDHLNVGRAVIASLSMGGYVALAFARQFPDRLRGLILADTRAAADTAEAAKGRRDNADRVLSEGPVPVLESMIDKLTSPDTASQKPEVVETLRGMLAASDPQGIAGALRAMAERPDSTPGLSRIEVPCLVIVGAEDVITPPKDSRFLAEQIPGAQLVEISGAGHVPNLEQPAAFNAAVRSFLKSLNR